MKLTPDDSQEAKLFFRSRGYPTYDDLSIAADLHRTTISKKLTGASEITIFDMFELVEKVTIHRIQTQAGR